MLSFYTASLERAKDVAHNSPMTAEIEEIITRCISLQRRDEPRYAFWLTPQVR